MAIFIADQPGVPATKDTHAFSKKYIVVISLISALGGYLFGFDFAVISGALPFLQNQFHLDSYWEGFATGSLALGAVAGCVIAGKIADRYGRRPGLMYAALVFTVSSVVMALSVSREMFIGARFCAGIGVGMASMLSPMYIAEVAPAHLRGRLVAINQLTIVIGILITNLVNYWLRNSGADAWRWMFGLGVVPSSLFLLGSFFLPESPRWLVKVNRVQEAEKVLLRIGDTAFAKQALQQIAASLQGISKMNYSGLLQKQVIPAVLVGIGLAVFQQLCGINTVFNYAPKIFQSIGANQDDQLMQTIFIGGVNLVFTVLALLLVDKLGRKPLMLMGAAGLTILYIFIAQLLGAHVASVSWFLLAAIGLYAMTLAPVTWVLISEIFPNKVRAEAIVVATVSLWIAYFMLVFTFPVLFEKWKEQSFYIYAGVCAVGTLFTWQKVKETKGKSLESME
ncbi:MFS transporter, sugar porter (SP) family [Filimonas lacunae]|uniref:MFS transporter, sugar porter (SP) family n=1 Tax=Filimonas lacunae TaxID=477680 RepID=A0A173MGQ4_9BACT|nr:sugar porter family MFS transporter [Filimonas lacunae]BAV06670.1 sugar-proton symporter [Filimonas lacunae]SIT27841.1 MFS transporter, sugar porter (SP) family [Filimonas lacunae]